MVVRRCKDMEIEGWIGGGKRIRVIDKGENDGVYIVGWIVLCG